MNRSRPAVIEAIKFMQDGGIGKIYMARGLCFKPRPQHRQVSRRPDGRHRRAVLLHRRRQAATTVPTPPSTWRRSTTTCGSGPAPAKPFNRNRFHYNWHWQWDYGNGDTGNQGPHQFDIARWGLGKQEHPVKVQLDGRLLRRAADGAGDARHADGAVRVRRRHDPRVRHARRAHQRRGQRQQIGNLFYGTKGWLWIEATAASGSPTWARRARTRRARAPTRKAGDAGSDPHVLTSIEYPHYQNFVDAIRAGDPKILTCDILEGHLSASLPHLANIAYLVGDTLVFDGKTETFKDDKKADRADARIPQGLRGPEVVPRGARDGLTVSTDRLGAAAMPPCPVSCLSYNDQRTAKSRPAYASYDAVEPTLRTHT